MFGRPNTSTHRPSPTVASKATLCRRPGTVHQDQEVGLNGDKHRRCSDVRTRTTPNRLPESSFICVPQRPPSAAQWAAAYVRGKRVQREEVAPAKQSVAAFLELGSQAAATAASAERGAKRHFG
jgi:hypothetical protein